MRNRLALLLLGVLGLAACGGSSSSSESERYSAEIRRTPYGIPHVTAEDWGSLAFGYGYAYAQDNYCVTMREVVLASGRSAELMGETEGDPGLDFLMRYLNGSKEDFEQRLVRQLPDEIQDLGHGFAAGMNRYLRDTEVENLAAGPAGCRNAPWVSEFDDVELWRYLRRIALGGSSDLGLLRDAILAAEGPDGGVPARATAGITESDLLASTGDFARLAQALRPEKGSNGWAFGRERTRSGRGMVLGNPHQPWSGSGRWYEVHLTIPGVYDVAGAALQGLPWVGIGFNKDVAWTHTVSQASRFTLYELALDPADPLRYRYDDEWRAIEPERVEILVRRDDGTLETRSHTFWTSHYGPVVNLKEFSSLADGWPLFNGTVLAIRDVNLETALRSAQQWLAAGQARDVDEYANALRGIGNPVFHTLAADREGVAFYGEVSAVPHVTEEKRTRCTNSLLARVLAQQTTNAIIALDGSTSSCEWGEDPDSPPGSGSFGYSSRPILRTTDYVANSNNSYWLSSPTRRLEGFPLVMGWTQPENRPQSLRTRMGHVAVEDRRTLSDGLSDFAGYDIPSLQGLLYENRALGAEIALDDVLAICEELPANPSDGARSRAREACAVLAGWDRRANLESRGVQLFHEFWRGIEDVHGNDFQGTVESQELWTVGFDPADPVNTPRGIDRSIPANRELVIDALSEAVLRLRGNGVAIDAPWGEVQFYPRNAVAVPIHGGPTNIGLLGAISAPLEAGGYFDISAGNSYIQAVTWDDGDCPIAETILTHSQSTDPASPHFGDQTALYSQKEWVPFPLCEAEVAAAQVGDTLIVSE